MDRKGERHGRVKTERDDYYLEYTLDLIQSRYKWTDEQVFAMPYASLKRRIKVVVEQRSSELKERRKLAAFIGWQVHINSQGWKKYKDYVQWMRDMGVGDGPSSEEVRHEKQQAHYNAERAMGAFGVSSSDFAKFLDIEGEDVR